MPTTFMHTLLATLYWLIICFLANWAQEKNLTEKLARLQKDISIDTAPLCYLLFFIDTGGWLLFISTLKVLQYAVEAGGD